MIFVGNLGWWNIIPFAPPQKQTQIYIYICIYIYSATCNASKMFTYTYICIHGYVLTWFPVLEKNPGLVSTIWGFSKTPRSFQGKNEEGRWRTNTVPWVETKWVETFFWLPKRSYNQCFLARHLVSCLENKFIIISSNSSSSIIFWIEMQIHVSCAIIMMI